MDFAKISAWEVIGYGGQGLFAMRFIWQWFQSERAGRSFIPVGFWWFSLIGGVTLAAYAVHIKGWPIVIGQLSGLIVYTRNLWMIYRPRTILPEREPVSN